MKIVIAPKNNHFSLLNLLRKDDPFLDIKLFSKEELIRNIKYSPNESSLIYLMKEHHYSYEVSKMLLENVFDVNNENINQKFILLRSLKEELTTNNLYFFSPIDIDFSLVDVIGYPEEDFELKNALEKLKLTPRYLANTNIEAERTLLEFDKIENEVYYVLNKIAYLIDKGIDLKDIYILRRNSGYDYYLKKFATDFGYQINIESNNNYLSTGGVKEFLRLYDENKDINLSLETLKEETKEDLLYLDIEDIVNESIIDDCSFDIQRDYLFNKFKEKKIRTKKYYPAINVIDYPLLDEKKYVFVIGFSQGQFPRSYKDDKYLNNEELHIVNRLNSKDKTKIDELSFINFINSNNSITFSYSKKSVEGDYYPSPIAKKFIISHPNLDETFYSSKVLNLIYSNLKDLDYFYKERKEDFYKIRDVINIDYNTYDNKYIYPAKVYDKDSKIYLSTSSLNLYSECPFHYYLEKIIKLDEVSDSFSISVGKITHHMFEVFRNKDFNLDKELDLLLSNYELKPSEKYLLTHNIKSQIEVAINSIKEREKHYKNPKIYNEISLKTNINDKTILEGKIDNLVVVDDKYFLCIDYKTGNTKFDEEKMKYGLSTQLPTYTILTSSDRRFENYLLAGIYINNVLTNSIKKDKEEDELIPSYLKLNGKTIGDINIISLIDDTIADDKSSFISGISLKKSDCSLRSTKSIVSDSAFKEYENIVSSLYVEMDKKLRNNEFPIRPLVFSSNDDSCQYCPYKDVCYVRYEQKIQIEKEKIENE